MKKNIFKIALAVSVGAFMFMGCGKSEYPGFKKTDSGLYYKFDKENKNGKQLQVGDILVGEVEIKLDTNLLISTKGQGSQRLFMLDKSNFVGDLNEGLALLHTGDEVTFLISADSMARFVPMPPSFVAGSNQKISYSIKAESILSKAEFEKEQKEAQERILAAKAGEQDSIKAYIAKNKITQAPTKSGIYIISVKKGTGAKAETGKKVKLNYTGSLLNGTVFDSSIEKDGKAAGLQRPAYEPLEFILGQGSVIPGWEEAVATMKVGDIVKVIIPSALAYGEQSLGHIPPFSPLVFNIELISVE